MVLMQGFLLPCRESRGRAQGGQAEVSLNKVSNWAALQALVRDIDSVIKKQHSAQQRESCSLQLVCSYHLLACVSLTTDMCYNYIRLMTFQKKREGEKNLEHLNLIRFKQERPILGKTEEAAHILQEKRCQLKQRPVFYFHFIFFNERSFCCLLAD